MKETINPYGGYRRTLAFGFVCLIYHATEKFCERNFSFKNDALGKRTAQMIGAARSARQNIVEGSSRAATSKKTEYLLYDVAKGSLEELAGDYEAFIMERNSIPWCETEEQSLKLQGIVLNRYSGPLSRHEYCKYLLVMRERFSLFLENADPIIASNSILITIDQACKLLHRQMLSITSDEFKNLDKYIQPNNQGGSNIDSPLCPKCGAKMIIKTARKGNNQGNKFWSCSKYSQCNGILSL